MSPRRLLVLLAAAVAGCSSPPQPEPIVPYLRYFESLRPEGVYLFETLPAKEAFDAELQQMPVDGFETFIDRTGERVFISVADTSLVEITADEDGGTEVARPRVEQIAKGYEELEDTQLFRFQDPDAPEPEDDANASAE